MLFVFSGSLGFQYPLTIPTGRGAATPSLSLNYSSQDKNFASLAGYGWSLPLSNIHRFASRGVDKMYARNDFFAEINGSNVELISIDSTQNYYGAKVESGFYKLMVFTILVSAPEEIRINRVTSRDNSTAAAVKERINKQWPDEQKRKLATVEIRNDNKELILPQIIKIDNQLKEYGKIW